MNRTSNLVYSDDLCCAFMTAIVRSYEQHVGQRHYLGRTAMQKLVYFAKVLGVPIPCSFEIYTYGPYSDTVTFAVDSLLADDVLRDTSQNPLAHSNYRRGANAEELLRKFENDIEPHRGTIDAVVQSLGRFRPEQLELVATLHFIHHRLRRIHESEPTKAQVQEEFRRLKGDKFTDDDVSAFYSALQKAGLICGEQQSAAC